MSSRDIRQWCHNWGMLLESSGRVQKLLHTPWGTIKPSHCRELLSFKCQSQGGGRPCSKSTALGFVTLGLHWHPCQWRHVWSSWPSRLASAVNTSHCTSGLHPQSHSRGEPWILGHGAGRWWMAQLLSVWTLRTGYLVWRPDSIASHVTLS